MLNKKVVVSFSNGLFVRLISLCKQNDEERGNKDKQDKYHNHYDKNQDYYDDKKVKYEKQKDIPQGLQKKLENGGTLPQVGRKNCKRTSCRF